MSIRQSFLSGSRGQLKLLTGADPGANTNFTSTAIQGSYLHIRYLTFLLTCDANAANRHPRLIANGDGLDYHQTHAFIDSTANDTFAYYFGIDLNSVNLTTNHDLTQQPLPPDFLIFPGHTLQILIDNIQAADTITNILYLGELHFA
ncbi:hypothetical protein LCGC14_1151130 [marine sediment metagenome]|uniref:Uncharacterized protein n=1 Tax=marine sediment metagenome TaxID=412755 RepID=A0A0F9Q112_9ZZZZ